MLTFSMLGQHGRLGNQLWQIAATIGIADSLNVPFYFPPWVYSRFFKNELPQKSYDELFSPRLKTFNETPFVFETIILDTKYDWDLMGYFQSWRYFQNSVDKVKHYFDFNFETNDLNLNGVAVHIRRGDYLGQKLYHVCLSETNYYQKAMATFPENTGFSIFSDDIEWCKTFIKGDNITYVIPTSDIVDLAYMSRHKHHIIANSSYSAWAAFLSDGTGITIAPRQWYGPQAGGHTKDLHPSWVAI
jgi:hypothetical protein